MIDVFLIISLAVFGLLLGSFAGASVWRLRARQLIEDKVVGEKVDLRELKRLKPLVQAKTVDDRSRCLHCHHQLAWYDLLPLVSWLQLRGRCRYCHARIGTFEPLVEIGTAAFFVVSYLAWPEVLSDPISIVQFGLWLGVGLGLIVLFCYDAKWFLLPNKVTFPVIGFAAVSAVIHVLTSQNTIEALISVIGACCILSGLYFVLYLVSKGRWIGFGDIKLGLALGLALADWKLAFLALFLANVIGCVVVLPAMVLKKLSRHSYIPFGPMLIAGFWIAGLFGPAIISWYFTFSMISV